MDIKIFSFKNNKILLGLGGVFIVLALAFPPLAIIFIIIAILFLGFGAKDLEVIKKYINKVK